MRGWVRSGGPQGVVSPARRGHAGAICKRTGTGFRTGIPLPPLANHAHRRRADRMDATLRPVGIPVSLARQRRRLPSYLNSGELRSWSRVASTTACMVPSGDRVSTTALGGRAA